MKQLFLYVFLVLCFSYSCFWNVNSGVSSYATIDLPSNLPDSIKEGGYSICVERVDAHDSLCTEGFLIHRSVADLSADLDLDSKCADGYRLKMWLWGDVSHKPLYGMDPGMPGSSYSYRDGYLIIDGRALREERLDLKLNFLPTEDGLISGEGSFGRSVSVDTYCQSEDGLGY